jgi:hypothetical protein
MPCVECKNIADLQEDNIIFINYCDKLDHKKKIYIDTEHNRKYITNYNSDHFYGDYLEQNDNGFF